MNRIITLAAIAGIALGTATIAEARDGCGGGFHRGPYGHCRPNDGRGPVVVVPRIVVGGFYPGRGYWDGHRYWANRYRHHDGWRYR